MKKILLPISMFLFFAVGCDNPMLSKSTDLDSEELQALSYELSSELGLSESSTDGLNDILKRHGRKGKHREPGFLWKVAGELADSLSDNEKAMLFEKMDDKDIPLFGMNKKSGSKYKKFKQKNSFNGIIKVLNEDQKVIFKEIKIVESTEVVEEFDNIKFDLNEIRNHALKFDKKNEHGNINFVLLKSIGECQINCKVDNELILEAFNFYAI